MLLPNLCSLRERSNAELDGATSPCAGLSPARSTTAAPPHPARSAVGAPIPVSGPDARPPGTSTGRFPRSLSFARRRRSPAVSQRHRHGYAADLPHGLPGLIKESSREVPAAKRSGGTHRARPVSTRFEPVHGIKDVTTQVPRVLLSATLAGPAPSGSAKTSRLCQGVARQHDGLLAKPSSRWSHAPGGRQSGLLPPSPAPPGSGCPQLHRPAATGRRRRSLTSTRTTAPRGAALKP
jgi:hypothetical protein